MRPGVKLQALRAQISTGAVRVIASDDADVHIELAVWLRHDRPATDFKADLAAHLTLTENGGTLTLADAHASAADSNDWELRATVKVPAGIDLHAEVKVGEVEVSVAQVNDVHAEVATGAVAVRVRDVAGVCRAKAAQGQIDIVIAEQGPAGGLDAEVATGAVKVALPQKLRGSFDLDVHIGGISADKRYGLSVEQKVTAASARGSIGEGGPSHRVHVGTGQIGLQ